MTSTSPVPTIIMLSYTHFADRIHMRHALTGKHANPPQLLN